MKIVQVLHGKVWSVTNFKSLEEAIDNYPPDYILVMAPDYVDERWGFDEFKVGDDRFVNPSLSTEDVCADPSADPEYLKTIIDRDKKDRLMRLQNGSSTVDNLCVNPEFVMDDTTGKFTTQKEIDELLDKTRKEKREESNKKLSDFLNSHPLVYKDGKSYGITKEDQTEIQNAITAYNVQKESGIPDPVVQWHSIGQPAEDWNIDDLKELYGLIYQKSYSAYTVNQDYKRQINEAKTVDEINEIVIIYETDEEKAARLEKEKNEEDPSKPKEAATDTSETV